MLEGVRGALAGGWQSASVARELSSRIHGAGEPAEGT